MMFGRHSRPMSDRIPDKAIDAAIRAMFAEWDRVDPPDDGEVTYVEAWDEDMANGGGDEWTIAYRLSMRAAIAAFFKAWGIGG